MESKRARVLLVEDDPDQSAVLESVFRQEGLDVLVAPSGEQALELHRRAPANVLVTDLDLPGMTGIELMLRLAPGQAAPLRKRLEDIVPIAERFLLKYAERYGTSPGSFSDGAIARLVAHDWPGNVRELRNVIEQTALFAVGDVVGADDLRSVRAGWRAERASPIHIW